ncbi:MAG: shikimate dehydrogenase [Crocinitomicaceae bacterium]|nr:shikimate dehydrogenase [Crocinitomicaceae bacterium]MCF8434600.1 shikimate dehydrogenase [Crocinitomicaceae bacterium]
MRTYGLIGKTLGYSFSKSFFERYFSENEIDAQFVNFELADIEEMNRVFEQQIGGLSVTIPYKESIIPFLDDLSIEAKVIGAVNCIQFKDGQKVGHNTDAYGFQQSIKPFLTNQHERALIFGTGGASKAIAYVLKNLGIDVLFISQDPKGDKHFSYAEVNIHMLNACKLLVNCTPVGTLDYKDSKFDLPFEYLTSDHLVVDLVYNPPMTDLLLKSKQQGATILNGESMLKHQALQSWKIWNNQL